MALMKTIAATAVLLGIASSQDLNINFGPPNVGCVPAGYASDVGDAFGVRDNGRRYGWLQDHSDGNLRQRVACNNVQNPLDATLIILDRNNRHAGESVWHAEVSPGIYRVTVRYSDYSYPVYTNGCKIQGMNAGVGLLQPRNFSEFSTTINVTSDGPLANRIEFKGFYLIDNQAHTCSSIGSLRIELIGTLNPTPAPTSAPSPWYAHPNSLNDINTIASAVTSLQSTVAALQSTVARNAQDATNDRNSIRGTIGTVTDSVARNRDEILSIKNAIIAATEMIPESVSRNRASARAPAIEASGYNLSVSSPGGRVLVESDQCNQFDLCAIALALNALRLD